MSASLRPKPRRYTFDYRHPDGSQYEVVVEEQYPDGRNLGYGWFYRVAVDGNSTRLDQIIQHTDEVPGLPPDVVVYMPAPDRYPTTLVLSDGSRLYIVPPGMVTDGKYSWVSRPSESEKTRLEVVGFSEVELLADTP